MSTLETNAIGKYSGNNVSVDDALNLKSYDTAGRDALTSVAGDMIYNTTDSKVQVYDGSAWGDAGGQKSASVDFLVVAGGGGGSFSRDFGRGSGGGGAGGYLNSYGTELSGGNNTSLQSVTILADGSTTYRVKVGGGGTGGQGINAGNASNSQFSNQIAKGCGAGGRRGSTIPNAGGSAGGGAAYAYNNSNRLNGISPKGIYLQGARGGDGHLGEGGGGGGGGASGTRGSTGTSTTGGVGADGLSSSITGTPVTRGGGGAGGTVNTSGGAGGGGNCNGNGDGQAGTVNTGGGGGGGTIGINGTKAGGAGGSGTVILRWATADATIGATRTGLVDGNVQTDGSDSYIVFTGGEGDITFS